MPFGVHFYATIVAMLAVWKRICKRMIDAQSVASVKKFRHPLHRWFHCSQALHHPTNVLFVSSLVTSMKRGNPLLAAIPVISHAWRSPSGPAAVALSARIRTRCRPWRDPRPAIHCTLPRRSKTRTSAPFVWTPAHLKTSRTCFRARIQDTGLVCEKPCGSLTSVLCAGCPRVSRMHRRTEV